MAEAIVELRTRLAEIEDLVRAVGLLSWDQQTIMPPGGAAGRADQRATLGRVIHERFTADDVGRLIDAAGSNGLEGDDAALVRVARRDWDKARRVPTDLRAEMARAAAESMPVWMEARARSDFALLRPELERHLELVWRYVECFDGFDDPYDVLLDDYEEGMTTAQAETVLEQLRAGIGPLLAAVRERADAVDPGPLRGHFPAEAQRGFVLEVLRGLGFEEDSWRLDLAPHPFAATIADHDTRITTRWNEAYLGTGLFSALHECGHGLYERGVDHALQRTPLARIDASMALHESQSRLWENVVGRSRPFLEHWFPRMQAAFPDALAGADADAVYRAANRVNPSLIRTEADEATYNLHIVLRFRLERDLLGRRLAVADLPEAWNAGMRELLGVEVPDDARGVLQDVHWASGLFGYFPTYALGNAIAGQIWRRARAALPDLDARLAAGDAAALREWLTENLYRDGRRFPPPELVARAGGGPLDPGPYLAYLTERVGDVYGLAPAAPAD